ncbi:uncharacterized protein LOC135110822 [Scylla paramamosain]|uniref:uncharacterized protein LOC135110822 n=1 Tax=Scylla paramamosain TaxID=85552 RepID=UPI003082D6D2
MGLAMTTTWRAVLVSKAMLLLLLSLLTAALHATHPPSSQLTHTHHLDTDSLSTTPSAAGYLAPTNGTARLAAHSHAAPHLPMHDTTSDVMKVPPALRRRSSTSGGKTMRKDKRQTDFLPTSTYPRLVRSRKRKKRRQHKRRKERLRNLRRKGRNFRKRRRRVRQDEKAKNGSVLSASTLLDTWAVPLASSLPHNNAHLVELLTGGNKQFLVLPRLGTPRNFTNTKETTQSFRRRPLTKQLVFLPFQVVSGGGLKWLPYNPNIRVSIQVDGMQHRDHADPTHLPLSPTQEQREQHLTTVSSNTDSAFSSETDEIKDRPLRNQSRTDVTRGINTFHKAGAGDKIQKQDNTHEKEPPKSTNTSEDGKTSRGITYKKTRRRDNTKKHNSTARESGQGTKAEQHVNGSTSKEHKNVTRSNGRQRAMSSTDMVVWLADTLEGILRSGEDAQHGLGTSGKDDDACDSWSSCRVEKALQELANIAALPSCPCVYPAELPYQPRIYDRTHEISFK